MQPTAETAMKIEMDIAPDREIFKKQMLLAFMSKKQLSNNYLHMKSINIILDICRYNIVSKACILTRKSPE